LLLSSNLKPQGLWVIDLIGTIGHSFVL
jgi:hypothetical protein